MSVINLIFQLFPFLQDILHLKLPERPNSNKSDRIKRRNLGDKVAGNKVVVEGELILFIECSRLHYYRTSLNDHLSKD